MPVTSATAAPYAPASGILGLVNRHRTKGLPSPVDADVLARAGISDSLIPRTLQAMNTLDLLNDDGSPSAVLEGLRLAPEAEYQQRMAEWLNAAYADALAFVDPADATEVQIRDAFRSYKPVGQQDRMVSLFMGLFTAAGVMPEKEKQAARKSSPSSASATPRSVPKARVINTRRTLPERTAGGNGGGGGGGGGIVPGLPPALGGLLADLPKQGAGWTKERRDKFVAAFGVLVDYCFPIIAAEPETNTADDQ